MLAHARNTPGESRKVKLNPFLDEFVGLAYHGMRSSDSSFNVSIEKEYADCVGEVELMPQEMGQVLLNNALYAVVERSKQEEAGGFRDGAGIVDELRHRGEGPCRPD